MTFAARYHSAGVKRFFYALYPLGCSLASLAFLSQSKILAWLFLTLAVGIGAGVFIILRQLRADQNEYAAIMRMQYSAGLAFSVFALISLIFF